MSMKIIIEEKENKIIIEKSKFIGIIKKVLKKEDITYYLELYKEKYPDATHICYAYIQDNNKKFSDDNEPANTAGKPILDVLEKNNLNYTLAIVIRYFGGIKLGSNGLIRAYSNTINELLKDNTKEIEYGYLIRIIDSYNKSNELDYLLKNSNIIKKDYQDKIEITVIVTRDTLDKLVNINYQVIEERIL